MKWLYKLERKIGHFCLPNLMMIIIVGQGMVFLAEMLNPTAGIASKLLLVWPNVMRGEIWRLFTFVFMPASFSILSLIISLYLYYVIGHTLENEWGDFKFNAYYLCGILGAIVACAITNSIGTNTYINVSLFLAFATLYPDLELRLFFVLPVKIKYLAFMAVVYYGLMFLVGSWMDKVSIILSLAGYFLFFGGGIFKTLMKEAKYAKTRQAWRKNNQNNNNNRW